MTEAHKSGLGKETEYDSPYNPKLLFPLSRQQNRESLNLPSSKALPFHGEDLWTCYELSWLDRRGKPCVAIAYFRIPAHSPFMIESKSFKLYLNSLNHTKFENIDALNSTLVKDLSHAAGSAVSVAICSVRNTLDPLKFSDEKFECVDDLEVDELEYLPNVDLLSLDEHEDGLVKESLCSHLLR